MKITWYIGVVIGLCLISCSKYESPFDATTSKTVTGTIKDMERDRAIANLKVYVVRTYGCGTWFTGGTCSEVIDSTLTDSQGKYSITYQERIEGSGYSIVHDPISSCEDLFNSELIEQELRDQGRTITRNFNVWCPLVLKLELQIKNNENPPLLVYAYPEDPETFYFPDVEILKKETDTTVYLYTKPNTLTSLTAQYQLEDPNANFHFTHESFTVGIQDTLELSRVIDCNDF
ncbi:hypothetical protein [Maribacter aestuarii]|uniref:hypothetical protein n=1 Tax=Maribacter aestuarii TaxID=1130723 RepID=UPI00248BC404|nr:hypothetical protein [Maribacter aestuarii]